MARPTAQTDYIAALDRWLPGLRLVKGQPGDPQRVRWRGPAGTVEFNTHEEPHLATRDVHLVVNRLNARRGQPPRGAIPPRLLLFAPYVRPQQAVVLERAEVAYLDLAGNVHLDAPGLTVHVEGKRPLRPDAKGTTVTAGWVRLVLAFLVQPGLVREPYRLQAERAGVALGAIPRHRRDLARRGFLQGRDDRAHLARLQDLVPMWVQAYGTILRPRLGAQHFRTPPAVKLALQTRLRDTLGRRGVRWTLTGPDAAFLIDKYLVTTDTHIFIQPGALTPEILRELRAQPTVGNGDLVAIEAPGPLALEPVIVDGWPCAPIPLVYAELRHLGTEQAGEAADLIMPRLLEMTR